MTTRREGERLEAALAGWSAALEELAELHRKVRDLGGAPWRWLGDGTDDLASMSDDATVLIRAADLRLLAKPAGAVGPNSPWRGLLNDLVEQRRRMFGNEARYDGVEVARLDRLIEEVRGIVRRGT